MVDNYIPETKKIISYKRETSDTFTIKLDWKLEHDPGQFVMVGLPGIGECPISICSYSDQYIELDIRELGNVTNAIAKVKKGALFIRGPYGKGYPMKYFHGKDLVIVSGGGGIAPLKSVIEYVEKNRSEFKDVLLYLGFRDPADIIFRKQLKRWKKEFTLNVSFDKCVGKLCFDGKIEFVTKLVEDSGLDNKNKVVFICGPPIMMQKVVEILQKKGFYDSQIYLSFERQMKCGTQKCGKCMINGVYVCKDGPVFRYDEIRDLSEKW